MTTRTTGEGAVAAQRAALADLYAREAPPPGRAYALLDFPDHPNVGDSAIWLGEVAMLTAAAGQGPSYTCSWDRFDAGALRAAVPDGPLFLHGGGNLGDLWPHHQRFRERVLVEFRDRRVVQLPQSIHYRDPAGAAVFGRVVGAHPDFHLYVRDRPSLAFARAFDCPVTLAPDSAWALDLAPAAPPSHDVLMLLRTDPEQVGHDRAALSTVRDAVEADWLEEDACPGGALDDVARARVDRGVRLLSRGRTILTDRLHAHVMATLMGLPQLLLDNEYGKLAAYRDAWTADVADVRVVADAARAAALLA